jgi:hypothetical protein
MGLIGVIMVVLITHTHIEEGNEEVTRITCCLTTRLTAFQTSAQFSCPKSPVFCSNL